MTAISYQLYGSRNFPPLEGTLEMLAKAGYKEVEGYGALYGDPKGLRATLDKLGLKMTTGHMGIDDIDKDPAAAVAVAKALGMEAVFAPYVMPDSRPKDAEGWRAFGKRLEKASKAFKDAGIGFGWHNHDFELVDLGGGLTPLDCIVEAAPGVSLELDLGWVVVAGQDPVASIKKFGNRLIAVHVKDRAPKGQNADEDGWADVGHGTVDWAAIHAALKSAGVKRYVIEHDNPSDHARFASRSLETVKRVTGQ